MHEEDESGSEEQEGPLSSDESDEDEWVAKRFQALQQARQQSTVCCRSRCLQTFDVEKATGPLADAYALISLGTTPDAQSRLLWGFALLSREISKVR